MSGDTINEDLPKATVIMTEEALDALIEKAVDKGVSKALKDLGLEDFNRNDFYQLRNLLQSWNAATRTAKETFVRTVTTAILVAMALGTTAYFGLFPK